MTQRARRTEIILETHEVTVIRRRTERSHRFCTSCQAVVPTFTTEEASTLLRIEAEQISSLEKSAQVHFVAELTGPEPRICGCSGNQLNTKKQEEIKMKKINVFKNLFFDELKRMFARQRAITQPATGTRKK